MEKIEKRIKIFSAVIKATENETDRSSGLVSGLASTFGNKDRDGDIIVEGAFKKHLNKLKRMNAVIPLLSAHREQVGGVNAKSLHETDDGLEMKNGELDLNVQTAREQFSLALKGFLTSFSVGFLVPKGGLEFTDKGTMIKEIELLEISLVPVPANTQALISRVKDLTSSYKDKMSQEELKAYVFDMISKELTDHVPPIEQSLDDVVIKELKERVNRQTLLQTINHWHNMAKI